MIDRQKLETLLARRFPGSTDAQIAAAANAIMAMIAAAGNAAAVQNPATDVEVGHLDTTRAARVA